MKLISSLSVLKNGIRKHLIQYDKYDAPSSLVDVFVSVEGQERLIAKTDVIQYKPGSFPPSAFSLAQFNLPEFHNDGVRPPVVMGVRQYLAMALCVAIILVLIQFSRILARRGAIS
jgi:hypothetical protein